MSAHHSLSWARLQGTKKTTDKIIVAVVEFYIYIVHIARAPYSSYFKYIIYILFVKGSFTYHIKNSVSPVILLPY